MSFFYNAFSFISSFFTKQAEQDFDDLYLNQDDPIGNLAPLVPSKVEPATSEAAAEATMTTDAAPPAGPPGVFLVVVPAVGPVAEPVAEPSGVVLIEEPTTVPTTVPTTLPTAIDLLKLIQDRTPLTSTQAPDGTKIVFANATDDEYLLFDVLPKKQATEIKKTITKGKNVYYEGISKKAYCVEFLDENDPEPVNYDYTLVSDREYDDGTAIILGFIDLGMFKTKGTNNFIKYGGKGNKLIPVIDKTIDINGNFKKVKDDNKIIDNDEEVNETDIVNNIVSALINLNTCINNQYNFGQINPNTFKELFFGQSSSNIGEIKTFQGSKNKILNYNYMEYFNTNMRLHDSTGKKSTEEKKKDPISRQISLVMTYEKIYDTNAFETLDEYNKLDDYTISFSYVNTPVKPPKKILMTLEMMREIVPKLTTNNCIKGLFTGLPPAPLNNTFYLVNSKSKSILGTSDIANDETTLQIYSPANFGPLNIPIFTTKLAELQNKPCTLLTYDSLNTYLNILIAMLDKPHDILTGRVPEETQRFMMIIISANIEIYIDYLDEIIKNNLITTINGDATATINDKKNKFKNLIDFVRLMMPNFKDIKPSKNVNPHVLYENAIMLLVKDILTEVNPPLNPSFVTDMNTKFPPPPHVMGNDNVVINPDVMYLTTEITDRVNQLGTNKIRKYFSTPEVIDHGHIYNIDENTNIQFPENYKHIRLRDPWSPPAEVNYVTIHSYSETTQVVGTDNILHYNVYVWFTVNNYSELTGIIKYTTPFLHAPDCARVYTGYQNFDINTISAIFRNIVTNEQFTNNLSDNMRNLIPYLMMDQFYNAKSLQDDQNQLQVNQISTILPPPPPPGFEEIPTQFLGLCCDLTSAANGFNYYMSRPNDLRNPNSIVGYYHSNKKIWVTNGNEIKIQIINAPAKKASIDIFTILLELIDGATSTSIGAHGGDVGYKRNRNMLTNSDLLSGLSEGNVTPNVKRKKVMTPPNNKRNQENAELNRPGTILASDFDMEVPQQVEGRGANLIQKKTKKEENAITLSYYCDQAKWMGDDTKTEEYGQYVYYNTMADCLYFGNNFETYKNLLFRQVSYDMTGTKYAVDGTEYLSSNYFFDILSIDFIEKMIAMLKNSKPLINKMIRKNDENILKKIIVQCAIYILTKIELKPDNIYPPDEQIKRSDDLDAQYNEVINNIKNFIANNTAEGPQVEGDFDNVIDPNDLELAGGFYKKRIFRKNTNKKRTIRKKTNKKRTIRKKIRHTIFKTKKNHK